MNRIIDFLLCKSDKISTSNAILFSVIEFPVTLILMVLQYVDNINFGFPIIFLIFSVFYLCLIKKSIHNLNSKNWLQMFLYLTIIPIVLIFHIIVWIKIISGETMCIYCP